MKSRAEELIDDLLLNPAEFRQKGKPYALLQEYFRGFQKETLRALIHNDDQNVRRTAVWIVSELGEDCCGLTPDIIPLLSEKDRFISYYVLDILIVCAGWRGELVHVVRALQDSDEVIRRRAMTLMTRADELQLKGALSCLENYESVSKEGLERLLSGDLIPLGEIEILLNQSDDLTRKYGAILAKRQGDKTIFIAKQLSNSPDPDIQFIATQ